MSSKLLEFPWAFTLWSRLPERIASVGVIERIMVLIGMVANWHPRTHHVIGVVSPQVSMFPIFSSTWPCLIMRPNDFFVCYPRLLVTSLRTAGVQLQAPALKNNRGIFQSNWLISGSLRWMVLMIALFSSCYSARSIPYSTASRKTMLTDAERRESITILLTTFSTYQNHS